MGRLFKPNATQASQPQLSDPFGGHHFGDVTHGIDHERCAVCGYYLHAFKAEGQPCQIDLGPGSRTEPAFEDFGPIWAIRPELTISDIYGDAPCPDVLQCDSREALFGWLDASRDGVTTRCRRWYGRIAIRDMREFSGARFSGESFLEYIASGAELLPWPMVDMNSWLRRSLSSESPALWKLGTDWDFETIARSCRLRSGHRFTGLRLRSFPHQLARVIDDLQVEFRHRHPAASALAECCFLESWDVLRHVAEFCGKDLAPSQEARELMNRSQEARHDLCVHLESAKEIVLVQLAVYVAGIRENAGSPRSREMKILQSSQTLVATADARFAHSGEAARQSEDLTPTPGKPDPFETPAQRDRAIHVYMGAWRIPTRAEAATKLGVHYQRSQQVETPAPIGQASFSEARAHRRTDPEGTGTRSAHLKYQRKHQRRFLLTR